MVTNENIDAAAGKTHVKPPLIWPCTLKMVSQITMHWCCSNFYRQKIPRESCNKLTEGEMCPAFIFLCGQGTVCVLEECWVVFLWQRKQTNGNIVPFQTLRVGETE